MDAKKARRASRQCATNSSCFSWLFPSAHKCAACKRSTNESSAVSGFIWLTPNDARVRGAGWRERLCRSKAWPAPRPCDQLSGRTATAGGFSCGCRDANPSGLNNTRVSGARPARKPVGGESMAGPASPAADCSALTKSSAARGVGCSAGLGSILHRRLARLILHQQRAALAADRVSESGRTTFR